MTPNDARLNPKDSIDYEKMRYWMAYDILEWEGSELDAWLQCTVFRWLNISITEVFVELQKRKTMKFFPSRFDREILDMTGKYICLLKRSNALRSKVTHILMGSWFLSRVRRYTARYEGYLEAYRSLCETHDRKLGDLETDYYDFVRSVSLTDELYRRRLAGISEIAETDAVVAEWLRDHRAGIGSSSDYDSRFRTADRFYREITARKLMEEYYRRMIPDKFGLLTKRMISIAIIAEHPERFVIPREIHAELADRTITVSETLKRLRERFDTDNDLKAVYDEVGALMKEIHSMDQLIVG
ncbi:MAG: hypothetical protein HGA31_05990 [Candidatus Moranbacteria bacterium]|nr:hypothetical protein [Candidatus Moranbacteria bacterium]